MTAPPLLCAALEMALNRYLGLEPDVLAECGRLDGRVIAIHADGPDWEFHLRLHIGGVQVLADAGVAPHVRISAPPGRLLAQAWRGGRGEEAAVAGLRVEGDAELLSRFRSLLARVGFDAEEWLAPWIGDGAAHRLVQGLRAGAGWGRRSLDTLGLDAAEYLREETRDLVHRSDVEGWMDGVDRLRERADRLEARLERLARRSAAGSA